MSKTKHLITEELLDQLLANYQKPEDLIATAECGPNASL
jgi:putative transposase